MFFVQAEEGSEESSSDDKDQDDGRRVTPNHPHHPLHQPLASPDSSESSSCSATSSISGSEPSSQTAPATDHTSLFLDRIHQGVEEFVPQQQPSQINQVSSSSISPCEENIIPQEKIQENGYPLLQIVETEQKVNHDNISLLSEPDPKFTEKIIEEHSPITKIKIDDVPLTNGILNDHESDLDHSNDVPIVIQTVFEIEQATPKKDLIKIESEEKKPITNVIKSSKKGNKSKKNNSNNNNNTNNNKNQKSKSENERNKNSKNNKKKDNTIMDKSKPNVPSPKTEISLRPDAPLTPKPGPGAGSGSSTSKRMSKPEERLVDLLVTSSVTSQEIHLSSLPPTLLQSESSSSQTQASPLSEIEKEAPLNSSQSLSSQLLIESEISTSLLPEVASPLSDDVISPPVPSETSYAIEEDTSESSTATEPSVIELLGSDSSNSSVGLVPDSNNENENIEVIKKVVEDEEENFVFNAQNRISAAEKVAEKLASSIISEAIEEVEEASLLKELQIPEKETIKEPDPPPDEVNYPTSF